VELIAGAADNSFVGIGLVFMGSFTSLFAPVFDKSANGSSTSMHRVMTLVAIPSYPCALVSLGHYIHAVLPQAQFLG
jgi:hypothetical protein